MSFSAAAADGRVLDVAFTDDALSVSLRDALSLCRSRGILACSMPRPLSARTGKFPAAGYGIHWSDLDEDLSTEGLLRGDKVLTCGYFLHYAGAHRFQPIIREGSLAMVPDDVMEATLGKSRVYLADLHVIPGNSGSPLFLAPSFTFGGIVTDSKGGIPYGLLGVVSGYMWEDDRLTLRAATDYEAPSTRTVELPRLCLSINCEICFIAQSYNARGISLWNNTRGRKGFID